MIARTVGGVFASWGSLGHVTFAERGGLLGFTGPRVVLVLTSKALPAGVQVVENLHTRADRRGGGSGRFPDRHQ
jgi:acetyl-CoA carboxylase beta subunit